MKKFGTARWIGSEVLYRSLSRSMATRRVGSSTASPPEQEKALRDFAIAIALSRQAFARQQIGDSRREVTSGSVVSTKVQQTVETTVLQQ